MLEEREERRRDRGTGARVSVGGVRVRESSVAVDLGVWGMWGTRMWGTTSGRGVRKEPIGRRVPERLADVSSRQVMEDI